MDKDKRKRFKVIEFNKTNIAYILCIVVNTVVAILLSKLFSQTIEMFTKKESMDNIIKILLALLIVTILNAVVNSFFAQFLPLKKQLSKAIVATRDVLSMVLKLDVKQFEEKDKGYFMNTAINSSATYADNYVQMNINFVGDIICILLIIGYAAYINIWFGVIFILYIPIYYAIIKYPSKTLSAMQRDGMTTQDAYVNEIKKIVEDKKIINIDHADNFFINYCDKALNKYLNYITKFKLYQIITKNLPVLLSNLCQILILAVSAYFFYHGHISVGTILLAYQLSSLFQVPLGDCFELFIFYKSSQVHFERLDELEATALIENSKHIYKENMLEMVNIDQGSFYSVMDEEHHLFDIDQLTINQGDFVLIKGSNGSGKSVFTEYLSGFFDVDCFKGKIEVNHQFKDVAFLSYPILLINGTFQENLFGLPYDEKLAQMLNIQFQDKIINAQIRNLSYGEQQKLNLLRVLSYPSDILILDEPFTNLDKNTIKNLVDYLNQIKGQKTIFVIDHSENLDNIADEVLVIHNKIMSKHI